MKTAAKVFVIIGLIASIIFVIVSGFFYSFPLEGEEYELLNLGVTLLALFGVHGVITSILCLCAIGGHSKGFVIVSGILYFPISMLASILMFCIDPKDLNTY